MKIRVVNWNKHNHKRSGGKAYPWFKLYNNFLSSPECFSLTSDEKVTWIAILSLASEKNTEFVWLDAEFFSVRYKISSSQLSVAIRKFKKFGWIDTLRQRLANKPASLELDENRIRVHESEKDFPPSASPTETLIHIDELEHSTKVEGIENPTREIIGHYCEEFKKRYGVNPLVDGIASGTFKRLTVGKNRVPLDRLRELVTAYFKMNETWFVTKRHDPVTLAQNLNTISVFIQSGVENPASKKKQQMKPQPIEGNPYDGKVEFKPL